MLRKIALFSVLSSVGVIAAGCSTIDQMVEEGRNLLGMPEVAEGHEPKAGTAVPKQAKAQPKKVNEEQTRAKAEQTQKKAEAERKKIEQIQKEKDCTALVAKIKQEDRRYLGEELFSVLKEANLTCRNLDGFKNTSIDSFVYTIKECRTQNGIGIDNIDKKTSFLSVCKKISSEDIAIKIEQNIKNRPNAYKVALEKDKEILQKYPDPEDRRVVIETSLENYIKNDQGWDKYFEDLASMQWKPFSGYVVHVSSRKYGGILSDALEKRFNNTGKFTKKEQEYLKCRKTSIPGVDYCGKVPVQVNRKAIKNLVGGLNPLMQMMIDSAPNPTFHVFKLENQKLNVRRSKENREMVFNRNIRNAALELGLDWSDEDNDEFANWWVAPYEELIK